jgi:hypothetical protein
MSGPAVFVLRFPNYRIIFGVEFNKTVITHLALLSNRWCNVVLGEKDLRGGHAEDGCPPCESEDIEMLV